MATVYRCWRCQAEYDQPLDFCIACLHFNTIMLAPHRRTATLDGEFQVATARDLVQATWDSLAAEEALPGVRLQQRAFVLIVGPPGCGKSTLAAQAANCFKAPVVLLNIEERLAASVGERLSRLGIHRRDYYVVGRSTVDQAVTFIRRVRAKVVVLDSMQASTWLSSDIRNLVNACLLDVILVTSQVNAEGRMAGKNEAAHEADVIIDLEESGAWTVTKSRYGPTGLRGQVVYAPTVH